MTDIVKVVVKPNLIVAVVKPVQALVKVFTGMLAGPAGADGAATFLELTDTPNDYTSQGNKLVAVNPGGTALVFKDESPGVLTHSGLTGKNDEVDVQHLTAAQVLALHAVQDLSGKVDKVAGSSLVPDTEISKIHAPESDNQDLTPYFKKDGSVVMTGYIRPLSEAGAGTPAYAGQMRYNSTDLIPEFWNGSAWQSADCPVYEEYSASGQSAGSLTLFTMDTSKVLIHWLIITCTSSAMNWDAFLYSNNTHTDDEFQIVNDRTGNYSIYLAYPYMDKSAAGKLNIKLVLNSGSGTFTVKLLGMKMR